MEHQSDRPPVVAQLTDHLSRDLISIIDQDGQDRLPTGRSVSDTEKYCYVDPKRIPFALIGLLSALLLLIGLTRFAFTEFVLFVGIPFVLVNGVYMLLSYGTVLFGKSFDLQAHQSLVRSVWKDQRSRMESSSVDIYLPICGEDRRTILETWDAVQQLEWPGVLNVYVLDDSPADSLRNEALGRGFHYVRRPSLKLKKAGNLRNAFSQSSGEFILLLDADFCPRKDMLLELMPYLIADSRIAIVQSPQYFNVTSDMTWVEAGAGYVQELFYRLIQPARDRWGAAVCVGSCAVYRRRALEPIGGCVAIEHSEDMWTGFDVIKRGWEIRYVPIVLAKGTCPTTISTFFTQQYRWCCGSLSLIWREEFWKSPLSLMQKLCFASGFIYYLATAMNVLLTPFPPLLMVCLFPQWVHWHHLAFSILALIYTPFIIGLWSVYPFGLHFLTTREISSTAHLAAATDHYRGKLMSWVVTGSQHTVRERRLMYAVGSLLASSGIAAILVWSFTIRAILINPERWYHFIPPVLFTSLHAVICWRTLKGALAMELRQAYFQQIRVLRNKSMTFVHAFPLRTVFCTGVVFLVLVATIRTWSGGPQEPDHALRVASVGVIPRTSPPRRVIDAPPALIPKRFANTSPLAELGEWTVENAFAEIPHLGRGMRLRIHPNEIGVYFLAEYNGVVKRIRQINGRWQAEAIVDLSGTELEWLYSIAIHPQFQENGCLYLVYRTSGKTLPQSYRVSVVELQADLPAKADRETVLIEQRIDHDEHLGGDLAFDAAGYLMVSVGDNGKSHHDTRSQRIDDGLFSGILRIDVDLRGGDESHPPPRMPAGGTTSGYYIPNDNPFVGEEGALEEFWAIGLRNPFRISYDESSDRLWIGEVGQDNREEVELAASGTNHLWSFREGTLPYTRSYLKGAPPKRLFGTPVNPFYEYSHEDQDYCVIGGIVYWGEKFPELRGMYIFGDHQSGRVWALDPSVPTERRLLLQLPYTKTASTLVSIESDHEGNILFTNFASWPTVYKIARAEPLELPEKLSETGFFADLDTLTPMSEFISYEVTAPLWSDGMHKRRWLRLPEGAKINNRTPNDIKWQFPVGTIFLKHFESPNEAASNGRLNLETRVLIIRADGRAVGATYLWNDEATDAILQRDRTVLRLPVPETQVDGEAEHFDYHVPGFRDCVVCHNRENPVLGVNLHQLNRSGTEESASENQLIGLAHRGLLEKEYETESLADLPSLAALDDDLQPLEERALSYLHTNCSSCHFPRGISTVEFDLRMPSRKPERDLIGQPAKLHYKAIDNHKADVLISPGEPMKSAIYLRMQTMDREMAMPYLGRTLPDKKALKVIAEWIQSLPQEQAEVSRPR